MSQAHKGSRLLIKDAVYAVPFESTHFNFNEDAIGIQYGSLVAPSGSTTYTARKIDGFFGGGIAVDEATTNLAQIADNRWALAKSVFQGTFATTTATSDPYFITSARYDFKPRPVGSGGGWQVAQYNHGVTYTSGNVYTASIYVRKLNDYDGLTVRILNGDGSQASSHGTTMALPNGFPVGQWTRLSMTWTALMSSGGAQFYTSANENASFELANPQIEVKGFPTSFVVGARGNGILKYDSSNIIDKAKGTISCWYYSIPRSTEYRRIISFVGQGNLVNGQDDIQLDISNTRKLRFRPSKAVNDISIVSNSIIEDYKWYHIVCSWGADGYRIYINGVLEGYSTSNLGIVEMASQISIGRDEFNQNGFLGGVLDELRIDKYTASDEEIMSWYIAQEPFYNPYDYRGYAY